MLYSSVCANKTDTFIFISKRTVSKPLTSIHRSFFLSRQFWFMKRPCTTVQSSYKLHVHSTFYGNIIQEKEGGAESNIINMHPQKESRKSKFPTHIHTIPPSTFLLAKVIRFLYNYWLVLNLLVTRSQFWSKIEVFVAMRVWKTESITECSRRPTT